MPHRLARLLPAALLFLVAAPASAQNSPDPILAAREEARILADQGMKHIQAGHYELAITAFREAEARFHALTILLELARAHDRLGQLLEARDVYRRIVAEQLANYAPPVFFEAQRTAAAELAALEPRIPTLQVVLVSDRPRHEIAITLNGTLLPATGSARIQCNPGRHLLEATISGRPEITREFDIQEGASERVVLELQPPPPLSRPKAPLPAAPPVASPPPPAPAQGGSLVPAFIGFGVGAAGPGLGAVTGVLALNKVSALEERCPALLCEPSDKPDHAAALRLSTISTIGFIAGGAGLAAGVTLLILRPGGGARPADQTGLLMGPTWIGYRGGF